MPEMKAPRRLLLPIAVAFTVGLGGCSADLSSFSATDLNPFKGKDPLRSEDYNYFYRRDQSAAGYVTANDLVGPDGRCAFDPAPTFAGGPQAPEAATAAPASDPINPRSNQALYFTAGPETGNSGAPPPAAGAPPEVRTGPRGIALSMT